ncbi:ATP-binding protein [Bdellovibrio sp. SKB1291214]|uniref:ATP/GTP-binding protein n=1 Tax=Bdellovibrio sp. SKB1291214 TaxID=1732569 RepID=UPI00223E9D2F|nr:ATP-binding protein [Bdellovibrio sp. SKB1291214]UYL07670.1 ATP-binding protein [Bdellovibrio sp. SKB1291214]
MKQVKIVITGGPSGGKTTLIEALKKELGQKCAVVPEAASILYRGGFPRSKESQGAINTQRAIYFTQKELEDMVCKTSGKSLIVCDRGSIDALAYWPASPEHFFDNIGSDKKTEFSRYDWVLHLDTADADHYDTTNAIRTETFDEASTLNSKIMQAWEGHPRRIVIGHNKDFLSKMTTALSVINAIMAHKSADDINKELLT